MQIQTESTIEQPLSQLDTESPLKEWSPQEYDWLSKEFSRLPYMLYKFWLVASSLIVLWILVLIAEDFLSSLKKEDESGYPTDLEDPIFAGFDLSYMMKFISFSLLLYGSGEMLFAMSKRKSRIAQKGFLKLQYSLMGSVASFAIIIEVELFHVHFLSSRFQVFINLAIACIPVLHIIGGFAVLGVFKRNHPLAKYELDGASQHISLIQKDFLEQNEAIASKLSEYDQQLNTRGYLVYQWWLKFVIILEITRISQQIFYIITAAVNEKDLNLIPGYIALFIAYLLSFWSALEIEVAIATKALKRLRKGILLLKFCIIVSIITEACLRLTGNMDLITGKETFQPAFLAVFGFVCCGFIPIVIFIGAFRVKKIIEQREKFAAVSSFNNESYFY